MTFRTIPTPQNIKQFFRTKMRYFYVEQRSTGNEHMFDIVRILKNINELNLINNEWPDKEKVRLKESLAKFGPLYRHIKNLKDMILELEIKDSETSRKKIYLIDKIMAKHCIELDAIDEYLYRAFAYLVMNSDLKNIVVTREPRLKKIIEKEAQELGQNQLAQQF